MKTVPLTVNEVETALAAIDAMSTAHVDIERCAEEVRRVDPRESVRILADLGTLRAAREIVRSTLDTARRRALRDAQCESGPRAA